MQINFVLESLLAANVEGVCEVAEIVFVPFHLIPSVEYCFGIQM